jgi:hypothetical protein
MIAKHYHTHVTALEVQPEINAVAHPANSYTNYNQLQPAIG